MFKFITSALIPRIVLFRKEAVLLWHAFRSPHTPLYLKLATVFAAFYLVNPFDIIPDVVPFLGVIDDLILIPLLVSWIVSRLPVPAKARASGPTIDGRARRL